MYTYARESMVAQGDYGAPFTKYTHYASLPIEVQGVFSSEGLGSADYANMRRVTRARIQRLARDIDQQKRQYDRHIKQRRKRAARRDADQIAYKVSRIRMLVVRYKGSRRASSGTVAPVTGMQRATHTPLLGPQAMAASILQSLGIQPAPSTAAEQAAAAAVDAVAASSAAASTAPAEDVAYWYESGYTQGNGAAANGEGFVSTPLPPRPFWTKPLFYVPATALGLYGAYQYYQARQEA